MAGGARALIACAALIGPLAQVPGRPSANGPPPGHTGGFGEPTCHACHADNPLNHRDGVLTVTGLPPAYRAGREYVLVIELARPGLARAGFQLAARFTTPALAGRQAGQFSPEDSTVALVPAAAGGVLYVQHTWSGAIVRGPTARWRVTWRAPATVGGPVAIHVAANAANDDDSEFGDYIYAGAWSVDPADGLACGMTSRHP